MDNEDLVSIIVPVYNAEEFINDTIKTVQDQTYKNWELIMIDDCSTDRSTEQILKYKSDKIKLIKLKKNSGAAICRNTGTKEAKGRYIAFLDADDLWKKEKLEVQLKFMKDKKCAFSFTGYEFADKDGVGNGKIVKVPEKINYKQALKNTIISTITVMLDTNKLDKELILMPNVRRGQDTATWWKILKKEEFAYGLNKNLSLYRRGNNTLSSNKMKALKRTWNLYRNVEKLNLIDSIYNFSIYTINAIRRRI